MCNIITRDILKVVEVQQTFLHLINHHFACIATTIDTTPVDNNMATVLTSFSYYNICREVHFLTCFKFRTSYALAGTKTVKYFMAL